MEDANLFSCRCQADFSGPPRCFSPAAPSGDASPHCPPRSRPGPPCRPEATGPARMPRISAAPRRSRPLRRRICSASGAATTMTRSKAASRPVSNKSGTSTSTNAAPWRPNSATRALKLRLHPGVDEPVQAAAFLRVGEHQLCQLRSVQLPILIKIIPRHRGGAAPARPGRPPPPPPGPLASASKTSAPSSANIRATVLFPVPAPPVMAIFSIFVFF